MIKKNGDAAAKPPQWYLNDLVKPFRAGVARVFILHGDINGLVANPEAEDGDEAYVSLRKFLDISFSGAKLVMTYNISSGLWFLEPEMERIFRKAAELESDDPSSKDPIAAAKADLQAKRSIPRDPENCLPLIEKALRNVKGAVAVIQSAHFIAPSAGGGAALPLSERTHIERLRNF